MSLKTLNCPRCGALIYEENGLDTFFCRYCGSKIILPGQSVVTNGAKVRTQENQPNYVIEKDNHKFDKIIESVAKAPIIALFIVFGTFFIVLILILGIMVMLY